MREYTQAEIDNICKAIQELCDLFYSNGIWKELVTELKKEDAA